MHETRLRRPVAPDFVARLEGRRIEAVGRRGKYILIDIGAGETWVVHLGMSGRLLVGRREASARHVHIEIELSDGGHLHFQDPRRFGSSFVMRDERELGQLGLEPLGPDFHPAALWALRSAHKRITVKSLLMDQRFVVGVGNIYASEALFLAGVRPSRRCARLTRAEVERIVPAVRQVLLHSIESGGSTLSDYRDGEGREGAFQRIVKVYGRGGEPCHACGHPISSRVIAQRNSFWCSSCQK